MFFYQEKSFIVDKNSQYFIILIKYFTYRLNKMRYILEAGVISQSPAALYYL